MADVRVMKRGKVYQYQFEIAPVDGKRKYINKSGFKTKKEAFDEGVKAYNEYEYSGKKVNVKDMSYSDYLDYWVDNYAKLNLRYSTIMSYCNIIKNHIKPRIGHYRLSQLDTRMLQEMMNSIYVQNSFSKCFIASILKVLKGSLKYACYTLNYINSDPAENVHAPRYETIDKDPAHIFTQEEVERILERFRESHSIYYSLLTAYYTGLRVSEVYGLTWDCVNCKNSQSQRTISIGDRLVEALKEYKKEQEENRKFYGDSYLLHYEKRVINEFTNKPEIKIIDAKAELEVGLPEAQLVFVKENGQFLGTDTPKYAFKVIHYELGINSRFHDFRDTHATRLIESGADIKAVSKRLGHSTIDTTYNIYVRVTEKMQNDTVEKFEDYAKDMVIPKTVDKPYFD